MTSHIYTTVTRILFPSLLLYGAYVAFHGHLTPGGAFPAGVVIATAFLMMYVSRIDHPVEQVRTAEEAEDFGLLLLLGVMTAMLIKVFLSPQSLIYTPGNLYSALGILSLNLIGTIKVAGAVTAIIIAFFLLGREK